MTNEVRGGVDSFALYKEEVTHGTDPGTWTANALHFGIESSIKPNAKRNLKKLRGMSGTLPTSNDEVTSRDAIHFIPGKFEVSASIEFSPQDFRFMALVMGSESGTDPYYYPQLSASTEAEKKKYLASKSFSLMTRYDFDGTGDTQDKVWIYTGNTVNSCSIKAALGEEVTVSLDVIGGGMKGDVTTVETNYPYTALSSAIPYDFTHASVDYAGSALANIIEGFDMTLANGAKLLYGLGSETSKAAVWEARDVTVTLDLTAESTEFMDDFMGGATTLAAPTIITSVTLNLVKSGTTDTTITLKNLRIPDADNGLVYGEVVKEKVTLEAEYCYVVENVA